VCHTFCTPAAAFTTLLLPPPPTLLSAGTGQNAFGLNWGNGFITDAELIRSRSLSDAAPFFKELVSKPYVSKVGGLCRHTALTSSAGLS
jgi:hypothetical protein